jgi:hypothetical protein
MNVWGELTIDYILAKSFAQKVDSHSRKREINCSKSHNSKLPLIGANQEIYPSTWMVSKLIAHNQLIEISCLDFGNNFEHMGIPLGNPYTKY